MTTRERHRDRVEINPRTPIEPEADRPREGFREAGDAFLDAADDAIEQALSRDARTFLLQNRQMGGQ
ncbi:MAG TPA: hypothetical protein VH702_09550 [Vicinamibacterales bacterium]|jgi:hypothetical protein